jgi:hypothetical protein
VRRIAALGLVALLPLLIAAKDPRGDVRTCDAGAPVTDPTADVVAVDAVAAELGTAAVWRVTFAEPIPVPDRSGTPLQIDVLVRDPKIAPVTRGDERGMNRIVRWTDTSADATEEILWVYERSHTSFNPPQIEGRTVELTVPGRILLGEAENGTEFVRRARWSLVVRDGDACDRVGGVPTFHLRAEPAPPATPARIVPTAPPSAAPASPPATATDTASGWPGWAIAAVVLLGAVALPRYFMRRRG